MSGAFGGSGAGGPCPCGVGDAYDSCCGPLHRGEARARTAEQLMRSRYAAYARCEERYLLTTWHPSTRPSAIEFDPSLRWHALEVLACEAGMEGDLDGTVEFRAHFRQGSGGGQMHEVSRFTRRAGRWVYLDGQLA